MQGPCSAMAYRWKWRLVEALWWSTAYSSVRPWISQHQKQIVSNVTCETQTLLSECCSINVSYVLAMAH